MTAQINVGPVERVTPKVWEFKDGDIDMLKKTTTIFIIGEDDAENRAQWDSALRKSWSITDIEIKTFSEFSEMESYAGYSFIMVSGYLVVTENSVITHYYLLLWMPDGKEQKVFARIELFPDFKSDRKMTALLNDKDKSKPLKYMNGDAFFYNWYPGMISKSLAVVNQHLKSGKVRWLFTSEVSGDMAPLREKTLYIVDYCLMDYGKRHKDEEAKLDAAELMEGYAYPYQFVSPEELEEMLLNETESFYYLTYVHSSSNKYLNVVNSSDGEIIYSDYTPASYKVKSKDFDKLNDAVKGKKK